MSEYYSSLCNLIINLLAIHNTIRWMTDGGVGGDADGGDVVGLQFVEALNYNAAVEAELQGNVATNFHC